MDDKFKVYDEIVSTATQWLMCFMTDHNQDICFTDVDWHDEEDLCILSVASWLPLITGRKIYYKGNIFTYLILKYIKHYKILQWRKFDMDTAEIVLPEFEKELMLALSKHPSLLAEIYQQYYKR